MSVVSDRSGGGEGVGKMFGFQSSLIVQSPLCAEVQDTQEDIVMKAKQLNSIKSFSLRFMFIPRSYFIYY